MKLLIGVALVWGSVHAQTNSYPFKPYETSRIEARLEALTEGQDYVWNIHEMERRGLNKARTKVQPWGGSYWPLRAGLAANTYQDKDYNTFIFSLDKHLNYHKNISDFKKRSREVYPKIYTLEEKKLAKLAPTEKYDLLLGDTSFDLTSRIWDYTERYGANKQWSFISSIAMPNGYKVNKANDVIESWEGICHGWAIAAGHYPRPEKTVVVTLPNGKKLPFYPNDIKALVSLMWANSLIQNDVLFEGTRCNKKKPTRDEFGRYTDPECADVHPAIFHTAVTNILGIEGRSFVVDKSSELTIANQPVAGYELVYYNPKTGDEGPLSKSLLSIKEYGEKDRFRASRNKDATHIVGVDMKLFYVDWEFPKKAETNLPKDDKVGDMDFNYDLEIDARGNIVGGQWRVKRTGGASAFDSKTGQPDFFWVVPKNWKNYFRPLPGLPKWNFEQDPVAPEEIRAAARAAHGFTYEESEKYLGFRPTCPVVPVNGTGGLLWVDCELRTPKPQPLIQIIDRLVDLSRK